jgi:hypothetical protein
LTYATFKVRNAAHTEAGPGGKLVLRQASSTPRAAKNFAKLEKIPSC